MEPSVKFLPTVAAGLAILLTVSAAHASVGFTMRSVPDGANPPIEIGIWYPALAPAHPTAVALFTQMVAPDAPVQGRSHPLVVMSHGNGGEFSGHGDTAYALAEAGFVVAAPTHTGDNYRDQSRATDIGFRVQQVSAVIDFMGRAWQAGAIDPARIGGFGFSAGGLTVLIAAGGEPDLSRIGAHCTEHPAFFDCRLLAEHHVRPPPAGAKPLPFPHDTRMRAIVVAAPALGFTFTPDGLRHVTVPVQLWRADADTILPAPYYADAVRAALPAPPDFHTVPNAGHFDFLAPCSAALAHIAPPICVSAPGFDRARFHAVFNDAVVAFFKRTLGGH
jgi:predicted dienelactone hydrolase